MTPAVTPKADPASRRVRAPSASCTGTLGAEVTERRLRLFVFLRQGDPRLDAVHRAALGARLFETLGMGDAATGDHPVDLVGLDGLLHADTVPMHDLAGKQVGHRGEADVRMRAHVDGFGNSRRESHWADVVEENERADHVPACEWQHAADFESAQIAAPLVDDLHDESFTRLAVPLATIHSVPGRHSGICFWPRASPRESDMHSSARSIKHSSFVIERRLDHDLSLVYRAWIDPAVKSRWFTGPADKWQEEVREMDVRVGGRDRLIGKFVDGSESRFESQYLDVVPERRLVYTYDMYWQGKKISVSLASVEFVLAGKGTKLVLTEQHAFLDGHEDGGSRERGTRVLIDKLGVALGGGDARKRAHEVRSMGVRSRIGHRLHDDAVVLVRSS